MRRAIARALAEASLPRRGCPSARVHAWRAPPSRSAPRRSLSGFAEDAELDALVASRLAAAVRDPDVVARVLPHLPRPLVSRGSGEGERTRGAERASPSSSASRPTRVAVGISGGVDSAVAAWLLKSAGFDVTGVLMRNWDEAEETGGVCEFEKDQRDARAVAAALEIELKEVDFVREYWHAVFEPFLRDFERGNATPNPDLACNRHIKFGALLRHCEEALGADVLATGHYARVAATANDEDDENPSLLRGVDESKDQSYFLASVRGESLRRACFPLGGLTKKQVKALAAGPARLPAAVTARRSSAGICFVGRKQNFGDFIAEYGDAEGGDAETSFSSPGAFVSVDDGRVIGTHGGLARYTIGQRARVGGAPKAWYVVGKDASVGENVAYVAPGSEHEALFFREAAVGKLFWTSASGLPPGVFFESTVEDGSRLRSKSKSARLTAQTRYGGERVACEVRLVPSGEAPAIEPTRFGPRRIAVSDGAVLEVRFDAPTRALTPGQALVLYDGDACLGGGSVLYPGRSSHELAMEAE